MSAHRDLKNRVAAGFILCFWGLGLRLNKQKTTHSRRSGDGWFGVFVATDALLAVFLSKVILKHKSRYRDPKVVNNVEDIPQCLNDKRISSVLIVTDGFLHLSGMLEPMNKDTEGFENLIDDNCLLSGFLTHPHGIMAHHNSENCTNCKLKCPGSIVQSCHDRKRGYSCAVTAGHSTISEQSIHEISFFNAINPTRVHPTT